MRAGFTVPQAYDSLLAKLIVWGEDRDQARRRMLRALDEFQIEGVPTTIPFHRLAMTDPAFVAGEVSTVLVEQGMDLSSLEPATLDGAGPPTAKPRPGGWSSSWRASASTSTCSPRSRSRCRSGSAPPHPGALERARAETGGPGKEVVKTPMQGTIVKVLVAEGDTVKAGQTLVVLEAMKMENHVTAHQAGTVAGLEVAEGQTVPTGATIAIIEATWVAAVGQPGRRALPAAEAAIQRCRPGPQAAQAQDAAAARDAYRSLGDHLRALGLGRRSRPSSPGCSTGTWRRSTSPWPAGAEGLGPAAGRLVGARDLLRRTVAIGGRPVSDVTPGV